MFIFFFLCCIGKLKKARKKKKKDRDSLEGGKSLEKGVEAVQGEPCHLSSVDEDCSKEITSMILELKHSVSEFSQFVCNQSFLFSL